MRADGEYWDSDLHSDKGGVYCESKVFGSEEFGDNKIVEELPLRDERGRLRWKRASP